MEHFYLETDNPNILDMDFNKFCIIKSLLDDRGTREEFVKVLPREIFSTDKYNLMEIEGIRMDMSPGKWLLRYLGNLGGRVSDLIYWFQEMHHEQALMFLKEEEPLQIIEQPISIIKVHEGEKFCITCKATGYPHPEYQWFKDDEELLLEEEQVISITSAKKENGGNYVCKISKRNIDSSVSCLLSDPVTVIVLPSTTSDFFGSSLQNSAQNQPISIKADGENIQIKPTVYQEQNVLSAKCQESEKIMIVKQPSSYGKMPQGSLLRFKCIGKASNPVKYQWYKNGRILEDQTSFELVVDELYPDQETRNMKFRFFCKVYNQYDEINSEEATVELAEADNKTKYVAEDKIAILIANDKYKAYKDDLVTPAIDVADLTKLLHDINFKVIPFRNLNLEEMQKAFQAFCKLLKVGSYAIVYFAGHGFGCNRRTYLQPVDCSENFLLEESVCTESITKQIQETKPASIVLLIDACRKEPPEVGNTLPKIEDSFMESNTVYLYATSYLNGAYESDERNSFFVKHLKKYIKTDKSILEIIFQVLQDIAKESLLHKIQQPVLLTTLSAARKLCDELRNPPEMITYRLPSWFYQERYPIQIQTQIIDEFKCYFIIEIKDHMNIYLNGVDINLYICVREDANMYKLCKSGLRVVLEIPSLKVLRAAQFKNAAFNIGVKNLILKEEVIGLQKIQNAEMKGQIKLKDEQNPWIIIEFSISIGKIECMNKFFQV